MSPLLPLYRFLLLIFSSLFILSIYLFINLIINTFVPPSPLPSLNLLINHHSYVSLNKQVRDTIVFSLFDQIVEDDGGRGGLFEGESSERVEKRFIGSFSIPFSTVFKEGRIEGNKVAAFQMYSNYIIYVGKRYLPQFPSAYQNTVYARTYLPNLVDRNINMNFLSSRVISLFPLCSMLLTRFQSYPILLLPSHSILYYSYLSYYSCPTLSYLSITIFQSIY